MDIKITLPVLINKDEDALSRLGLAEDDEIDLNELPIKPVTFYSIDFIEVHKGYEDTYSIVASGGFEAMVRVEITDLEYRIDIARRKFIDNEKRI